MGYKLNINNPQTFSEKLQWLKLYDRRPEYTTMVDKYAVKEYVAKIIGNKYIIPTIGVWDKPEDIDWESLPNQFVLKCTHDSGGLVICRDKNRLNKKEAVAKLKKALQNDYYLYSREWPYKNVPRRIIAEQYIDPMPGLKDLPDYKFFCFDGAVKGLYVASDRQTENLKIDFFDAEFNHLKIRQSHENAKVTPEKPKHFDMMKRAAEQLSKGIPHVRIDFYEIEDGILFGEMTFFSFSGMLPYQPEEWDKIFGDMLTLPGEKRGGVIIRQLNDGSLLIAEPDLLDYKFFCFNGEPKFCQVISGRGKQMCIDFFDQKWNHQPFHEPKDYPFANLMPDKPKNLNKMWDFAKKLSKDKAFSRIDFYEVRDKVFFGEITFFPTTGMGGFEPIEYDLIFGQMITLP